MVIRSIFVPDTCLQNDKFSAHVTWDKNHSCSVILKIPPEIKIDELFNVTKHNDSENTICIEKTDINGYVGFSFHSDSLDSPSHKSKLEFEIYEDNIKIYSIAKEIMFFRPEIEVISVPEEVNILCNEENLFHDVSEKIQITNNGQGTAQINVKIDDGNNCRIIPVSDIDEFSSNFIKSLDEELKSLSSSFLQYAEDIDNFSEILKSPTSFDVNYMKKIKTTITRIEEIIENDEEFNEKLIHAIAHSYFKNINPFAKLEEFKKYIDSIDKNKIIMTNSLDFFEFDEGITELNVILERTDLALNPYSNIAVKPIRVSSDNKCRVPIYAFFNWGVK